MSEKFPIPSDWWLSINNEAELRKVIPPEAVKQLGGGNKGWQNLTKILRGLTPFAPAPASFNESSFNAVIAFDEESQTPLPKEEAKLLFNTALEYGFINRDATNSQKFSVNQNLQNAVKKIFPQD
jgi:hypothetical protein